MLNYPNFPLFILKFIMFVVNGQWVMEKNTFEEVCDAVDLKFKKIWKIIAPQE